MAYRGSVALLCLGLTWAGCAHDIGTRLGRAKAPFAGAIDVIFSRPAKDVTIAVNGTLVVVREHTGRVRIGNVPSGYAEVSIVAGSGGARVERHVRVEVEYDKTTAIPVGAPERSAFSDLPTSIVTIVAVIAARLLYFWFL